jgi:hypothetical protein
MLPFLKSTIVVLNIISYKGHFSGIVLWPSVIVYELGVIGFQVSMSYERGHNPLFKLVGKNDCYYIGYYLLLIVVIFHLPSGLNLHMEWLRVLSAKVVSLLSR